MEEDPEHPETVAGLQENFERFNEQLREVEKSMEVTLGPQIEYVGEFQREWQAATARFAEQISRIDWRAVAQQTDSGVLKLAELGWTVPSWLTPKQVVELSTLDTASLDQSFTAMYLEHGYLSRVRGTLEGSPYMDRWKPLFVQSLKALEIGEHLIAIPSLLIMLEGFVAQFVSRPEQIRDTNLVRLLKQLKSDSGSHIGMMIWESTIAFFHKLYKSCDFAAESPSFINRKWILHGRDVTDWTMPDAIRLLNALATLGWIIRFQLK